MALYGGLSHLVLPVTDLEKSEKFYQDVFGLDFVGRDLVAESQPNSLLKTDCRQYVILVQTPTVEVERQHATSTHHAWLIEKVEDYKAFLEKLRTLGYDVNDYRASFRTVGEYSVDVVDPDGHRFQIQAQGPEATAIRIEKAGVVNCGGMTEYEVGDIKLFETGKFFLARTKEGFLALSQWCPHLNGKVKWRSQYFDFYCPTHGATFNRHGQSRSHIKGLPPLRLHPISINASGEVLVDTDCVIVRRDYDPKQITMPVCGAALNVSELKHAREMV